ncbi:transcription factor bHLH140 isoform X3 [Physcomitrium patens]|uniref:transcription factor bHLH140 isoform X3 n=1 Tax=Physcomitrium patens TaxID=3218 RepID=UPI000D16EFBB|nr:transcription factor bHLH140-like isoform X4 [Physcomitrium patens]|eukprot:XP_024389394.1 transcription factor bHLH140-like isoform X4 [Physcomitrella patens]
MDREKHLPDCKWGASCYRKNPEHLREFRHPTSGTQANQSYEKTSTSQQSASAALATLTLQEGSIDTKNLVLLMLVGPPGAGKSTVCQKIVQIAVRPWKRICQDVISNGKPGSKQKCLKDAAAALSAGTSVLIDRCNIDVSQRKEFLQLAKDKGVESHALVLNIPVKECIKRASERVAHEGGLDGSNAAGIALRFARSRVPPSLEEGFVRVTYCRTDPEIENIVCVYSQLGFWDHLPLGVFGASVQEGKEKLKSVLQNKESSLKPTYDKQELRANSLTQISLQGPMNVAGSSRSNDGDGETKASVEEPTTGKSKDWYAAGARSLAFPSISTADFQFDHGKAADIILETAVEFHRKPKHAGLRLVFVDLSPSSDMLSRVSAKAAEAGLSSLQLLIYAGDITTLHTTGGPRCNFIANATNWRLKPGGGGVNAAIFKAGGYELEMATKAVVQTVEPGDAVAVPLPATSPLRRLQGVSHVIHVLGPNMNSQRPNSLAGDYKQGCDILRKAYRTLFEVFSSIALKDEKASSSPYKPLVERSTKQGSGQSSVAGGQSKTNGSSKAVTKNAFTLLMENAKRKVVGGVVESERKRERLSALEDDNRNDVDASAGSLKTHAVVGNRVEHSGEGSNTLSLMGSEFKLKKIDEARTSQQWSSWAQSLRNIALHPDKHSPTVLKISKDAVVISDKFAKSKKHLLVIARKDGLDSITDIGTQDLPILQHMHTLGETWAKQYIDEDPSLIFRLGYHWGFVSPILRHPQCGNYTCM